MRKIIAIGIIALIAFLLISPVQAGIFSDTTHYKQFNPESKTISIYKDNFIFRDKLETKIQLTKTESGLTTFTEYYTFTSYVDYTFNDSSDFKTRWIKHKGRNSIDYVEWFVEKPYNIIINQNEETKYHWKQFNPHGKTIKTNEVYNLKLVFHKKAEIGAFSIQTIPMFGGIEGSELTWWNATWTKKAPVCINNTGGSALSHYQVSLNVTYDADMQVDFDDLRFVNVSAGTEEAYWIEDKSDSNWCLVWFNGTYIAGGGWSNDTTEMYYGNPSASSASNGTNTFEFFDDFEDGTVGNCPSGWTCNDDVGTIRVSDDYAKFGTKSLKLDDTGQQSGSPGLYAYHSFSPITAGIAFKCWARMGTSGYSSIHVGEDIKSGGQGDAGILFNAGTQIYYYTNGGETLLQSISANQWYEIEVKATGVDDTYYDILVDGDSKLSGGEVLYESLIQFDKFYYSCLYGGSTYVAYLDQVLVRKYASPEPTTYTGTEESSAVPTLTTSNIQNYKHDWGQDFSSNFSANVTVANASNVWMNFTHTDFTNTSLGNLNLTIDEWVNESHNIDTPITNISVTIYLNSTTVGVTNDTDTFYYEITNRTNTATMDSSATQTVGINDDFYINVTCNEEYGDTFYGAADLLEDGVTISTNSSIVDYVNFTWNESTVGVYNYTVRFYNLTHYDNTTSGYSNVTVVGPTLTTGNIQNYEEDWGRDWNSNFSANVTGANASEVWMNFTNAEFTNTSLGWLNRTLDEWVNESHNVTAPVTNVSVTVELTSTALGAANDSDTFFYEITKRNNTATMDSAAIQSMSYTDQDFFINATLNEEYSDTFYGAADLLEDGAVVLTNSTVTDYVNFTHNESTAGQYNYTVRFYNTTYYFNATTPTYSNVTIPPPTITLLSQDPSILYQNSTGNLNITYGISHGSGGLNNTSVSFIYTVYNPIDGTYNHSIRVPSNNRSALEFIIGEHILRADNRNYTLNFEDNATITRGNVYEWGGGDENTTRLTIEPVNSTYTLIHWNGTIRDTASINMWYLNREEQQNATMTNLDIHKSSRPCIKIWNLETFYDHHDYLFNFYLDTHFGGSVPSKPIFLYYLNSSYDPEGSVNPEDSPYGFFVTEHNASTWVDYLYNVRNSSYIKAFSINQSAIVDAGINTTNTAWVCFNTETSQSKPYSLNMTNDPTSTNRTFGECNVTWIGDNAPLIENLYTTNAFVSDRHRGHQFKHQLYIADNVGTWTNSTINTTDIEKAYFPPTKPGIVYFYYQDEKDLEMNHTYSGTFDIGIALASDPDDGDVSHNLTLHYGNRTFVAIINNTFNDTMRDNMFINISFDSSSYYSEVDNFTLQVNATDDEGVSTITWLDVNFTINPPTLSLTISGEQNIKKDWGQDWNSNFSAHVLGQNAKDTWMNFSHNNFTNTSLGWLNTSIDEWVNESHNIESPIINISVNVSLNSSTPGSINGTVSFYYEITKRNNTATMDSNATQNIGIYRDFFINASLIEEYGDTFYGAADLLEDGSVISTNSSIIDYVNFTWNESSVGTYNYTVRFYNLTHYNNVTTSNYSNVTVLPPVLTIGNVSNVKQDWGQDWSSNFSADVTVANASNVWMNFTNAEFTNKSFGNLNLTLDEWANESHNVGSPVTNVSVTIYLNSSTPSANNDTSSFYYEITKRNNTATMDSNGTQSVGKNVDFFINASLIEEYSDTFYGLADLLEDGNIISTNSSVVDYVNFTWNESTAGIYNYTVRFYNTTHYFNATTPTYSNVTVLIFTPPDPINLQNTTGNFYVNHTWDNGSDGYVTDSYNVSVNNSWYNTTNTFYNGSGMSPHGWSNISVWAFNSSDNGTLSSGNVSDNVQIPNNPITITNISDWTGFKTQNVYVDYDATDTDSDTPTFSCNRTDLFTDFSTVTGIGNWTSVEGIYYVDFGVSDGYGSYDNYTMTITVSGAEPGTPTNLQNTTGNFWINHTWDTGINTDTFNVSVNNSWTNDSSNTYYNNTGLLPHVWSNISVAGYNATTGNLSSFISQNTQIPNNAPTVPTGWTDLGMNLTDHTPTITWTKGTDADGDTVTTYVYVGTTSTPTDNETHTTSETCNLGNTIPLSDGTTYYYRLRSYDGSLWSNYTTADEFRMNSEPMTTNLLTEGQTNPTDISDYTPDFSWTYSDDEGDTQSHYQVYVGLDVGASDMWNSGQVASSATSATYAGSGLSEGITYYVQVRTKDNYEFSSWVTGTFEIGVPLVTYNISGYVINTTGAPLQTAHVTNNLTGVNDNTDATGYYKLEGIANDTYLLTATKDGYIPNSTTVTVNGVDKTNQNITLTESVAAPSITSWYNNITGDGVISFQVNLSQAAINFSAVADQTIITWTWKKDGIDQNHNYDNITLNWTSNGTKTVSVYGTNTNGTSNTVTWTVTIGEEEYGDILEQLTFIYNQNKQLIEENEMIGTSMIFGIFVVLAFIFLVLGLLEVGYDFYMDIVMLFISPTIFLMLGYQCYISEALLEFEFAGLLLVIMAVIIYIYAVVKIFGIAAEEFGYGEKEEDRGADYEYK